MADSYSEDSGESSENVSFEPSWKPGVEMQGIHCTAVDMSRFQPFFPSLSGTRCR